MYLRGFGAPWFMVRVEMKRKILLFVAAVSEKAEDCAKKSLYHFRLEMIGSKRPKELWLTAAAVPVMSLHLCLSCRAALGARGRRDAAAPALVASVSQVSQNKRWPRGWLAAGASRLCGVEFQKPSAIVKLCSMLSLV